MLASKIKIVYQVTESASLIVIILVLLGRDWIHQMLLEDMLLKKNAVEWYPAIQDIVVTMEKNMFCLPFMFI